jgi:hypothetical protein
MATYSILDQRMSSKLHRRYVRGTTFEQAQQRITRATEVLVDGTLTRERYDALCMNAEGDIEAAVAELATLVESAPVARALPNLDTVLVKVGGWAESLLKARIPTQREILGQLIEQVTVRRNGPKRRRLGPDYYDVEITWTELGRSLRDVDAALAKAAAA